jgi:high-affinity Fe2+/Pb2+ permease
VSGLALQAVAGGGVLLLLLVMVFFIRKSAKAQGKAEGVQEANEVHVETVNKQNEIVAEQNAQVVKDVEDVTKIHDRLESDPAYRDSVRSRFTRD